MTRSEDLCLPKVSWWLGIRVRVAITSWSLADVENPRLSDVRLRQKFMPPHTVHIWHMVTYSTTFNMIADSLNECKAFRLQWLTTDMTPFHA